MGEGTARKRAAPRYIDRGTVVTGALEVFAERGFHGSSMRMIAERAGTSLSNLYNYFPDKDALLEHVLEESARALADRLGDAVGAVPDGADAVSRRLIAAIHAYVDFLVERPAASIVGITEFRYLVGRDRSRVLEQRDRTEDVFRALVREGASAGEVSVADVGAATRALTTLCNGMSTWYRHDGPPFVRRNSPGCRPISPSVSCGRGTAWSGPPARERRVRTPVTCRAVVACARGITRLTGSPEAGSTRSTRRRGTRARGTGSPSHRAGGSPRSRGRG